LFSSAAARTSWRSDTCLSAPDRRVGVERLQAARTCATAPDFGHCALEERAARVRSCAGGCAWRQRIVRQRSWGSGLARESRRCSPRPSHAASQGHTHGQCCLSVVGHPDAFPSCCCPERLACIGRGASGTPPRSACVSSEAAIRRARGHARSSTRNNQVLRPRSFAIFETFDVGDVNKSTCRNDCGAPETVPVNRVVSSVRSACRRTTPYEGESL
jgi:hypothetical protein